MSVVLFTRAFPAANALVRRLMEHGALDFVVCERPRVQPRRTLSPAYYLEALRNRIADPRGRTRDRRALERVFGREADRLWAPPRIEYIAAREWRASLPWIEERRPEVIAVYGTSIVPREVYGLARRGAFNLHDGLVPHYRGNNATDFAILAEDFENIGATVHQLSEHIDGGAVYAQDHIAIEAGDDEYVLRYKSHALAHELFLEVLCALPVTPEVQPPGGRFYNNAAYTGAQRRRVRQVIAGGAIARFLERSALQKPKPLLGPVRRVRSV